MTYDEHIIIRIEQGSEYKEGPNIREKGLGK